MTGYRIGYTISSPEIINKLTRLQALCLTNVSEPIQFIAQNSINEDVSANHDLIHERLNVLIENCKKLNLEFTVPDGAMYIFAKIKNNEFEHISKNAFEFEIRKHIGTVINLNNLSNLSKLVDQTLKNYNEEHKGL